MHRILLISTLFFTNALWAQRPGGVPDSLNTWLKANEGVTINATNQVTLWTEYSTAGILGNFSTQGAAINKPSHVAPILNPNGINFNPYVVFNQGTGANSISSGNAVAGTALLNATAGNTIFQVFNLKQSVGTGVWLKWQWASNPYSGPRLGNEVNNPGNLGRVRFDFRSPNLVTPENVLNRHSIVTQGNTTTTKFIRLDGRESISAPITGTFSPGTTTGRLTVGAEPYGDDYPTQIDHAELIIYKRELTPAEINKVESYLAVKYGFTLDQTVAGNNYTASNNTIVWNAGTNNLYNNNITGIARDDASALYQKQSKSINAGTFVTILKGNYAAGIFPQTNNLNTKTFSSGLNYIIFGDNTGPLVLNVCASGGRAVRMARVWKIVTTGSDGNATIAATKANLPAGANTLIVSTDPTFNTNCVFIPMDDNGVELYANHSFSGEQFFTFGSAEMNLNAVADTICFGGLGNISLNPTGGLDPISFSWNSTPPQNTMNLTGVPAGTYRVTVNHGGNLCSFSENLTIQGAQSAIGIGFLQTTGALCNAAQGSFTVLPTGGTPPFSYSIDGVNYQSSNTFNGIRPGTYQLRIRDRNNCSKDTAVVIASIAKELEASVETRDAFCDAGGGMGYAKLRIENGNPPFSFVWDNNIGPYSNRHENLSKGIYNVNFTDVNGCAGNTSFEIKEIPCCSYFIPSAFSPNGDGLNDVFIGVASAPLPYFHITIFNRYGQSVFVSGNYDKGWDGTDARSGAAVDAGVYYYYLKYRCPLKNETIDLKGEVTLVR